MRRLAERALSGAWPWPARRPERLPLPSSLGPGAVAALVGLAFGTSVPVRGWRRSLRVLATAVGVATVGEVLGIRWAGVLRHHSTPQVGGLPLIVPLAWYACVSPAYGLAQAAVGPAGPLTVAAATAVLATATDLLTDPWGLDQGLWEWRDGGSYAPDVRGPNGVAGIPAGNFLGWLLIAGASAYLSERRRPAAEPPAARRQRTLLLGAHASLGLGGLLWAVRTERLGVLAIGALSHFGSGGVAWLLAGRRTRPAP